MAQRTIYLDDDLNERLNEYEEQADESVSQLVRRAIKRELEEQQDIRDRISELEQRIKRIEQGGFRGRIGVGKIGIDIPIEADPERDQ